jgi:hypothetical protein
MLRADDQANRNLQTRCIGAQQGSHHCITGHAGHGTMGSRKLVVIVRRGRCGFGEIWYLFYESDGCQCYVLPPPLPEEAE